MGPQPQHEGRQHVLEGVAAAQDAGFLEERAGRIALERLDEACLERLLDIGFDRPRAGLDDPPAGVVRIGVKAQRRAEGDDVLVLGGEGHQLGQAVRSDLGEHRVGGAEIDADRARRRHGSLPFRIFSVMPPPAGRGAA